MAILTGVEQVKLDSARPVRITEGKDTGVISWRLRDLPPMCLQRLFDRLLKTELGKSNIVNQSLITATDESGRII